MLSEKVIIIHLIVRLIKNISLYSMSYFPIPYTHSKIKLNVDLALPNYGTKSDLKSATCIDTWKFVRKINLANLKSNVDDLDSDKFKTSPLLLLI